MHPAVGRGAVTRVPAHPIHTRAAIPAGILGTVIDVLVAVGSGEPGRTHTASGPTGAAMVTCYDVTQVELTPQTVRARRTEAGVSVTSAAMVTVKAVSLTDVKITPVLMQQGGESTSMTDDARYAYLTKNNFFISFFQIFSSVVYSRLIFML